MKLGIVRLSITIIINQSKQYGHNLKAKQSIKTKMEITLFQKKSTVSLLTLINQTLIIIIHQNLSHDYLNHYCWCSRNERRSYAIPTACHPFALFNINYSYG